MTRSDTAGARRAAGGAGGGPQRPLRGRSEALRGGRAMHFNLPSQERQPDCKDPQIGYVYRARGGYPTKFWVVVAISETERTIHLLGVDELGNPCSTASYNRRAIVDRPLVGITDLSGIELDVRSYQ